MPSSGRGRRILFVHGMNPGVTAREVAREFERIGDVRRCDIPPLSDRDSRESVYAFVEMESSRDADVCYHELHNRRYPWGTLKIQWAKSARKRDELISGRTARRSRSPPRTRSRSPARGEDHRRDEDTRRERDGETRRDDEVRRDRSRSRSPVMTRGRSRSPVQENGRPAWSPSEAQEPWGEGGIDENHFITNTLEAMVSVDPVVEPEETHE